MSDIIWGECAPKTHQKGTPIGIFKPNCRNLKIAIPPKFDKKTQTINDTLWVNLPLLYRKYNKTDVRHLNK